jgi:hypothetical protein
MIRIDEIYNNTIWPWFKEHRAGTRVFFCDPFGYTDQDHLFNLGQDDIVETDFAKHTAGPVITISSMVGPVWIGSVDTIELS